MTDATFSHEDQLAALEAGFISTTEWAVVELVTRYNALVTRVEKLEAATWPEPSPLD